MRIWFQMKNGFKRNFTLNRVVQTIMCGRFFLKLFRSFLIFSASRTGTPGIVPLALLQGTRVISNTVNFKYTTEQQKQEEAINAAYDSQGPEGVLKIAKEIATRKSKRKTDKSGGKGCKGMQLYNDYMCFKVQTRVTKLQVKFAMLFSNSLIIHALMT